MLQKMRRNVSTIVEKGQAQDDHERIGVGIFLHQLSRSIDTQIV